MTHRGDPLPADPVCVCCGERLGVQWSDTHGVGACITCGMPYRIYHYEGPEGQQKRVDKPPEPSLNESGIDIAKRYWAEKHRRVFPACYDIGIGHNGYSYSGASPEDCKLFNEWYSREYPRPAENAHD